MKFGDTRITYQKITKMIIQTFLNYFFRILLYSDAISFLKELFINKNFENLITNYTYIYF